MAGRLPDTRQIRVVTERRGEFGDFDGERESLKTKDGERESLETKDRERESLETKDAKRESLETKDGDREIMESSRASQECRVQNRITGLPRTLDSPVNFGPGEEVPHLGSGAAHRRATSITGSWRPYIRTQSSGSWISPSKGVKPSERRAQTPNITSQKGERSIGSASSRIDQESPTDSTCEDPEQRARTPSTKSHAETSRTKSKRSARAEQKPQWDHPGQSKGQAAVCRKE
ncbi:splicing regulatory glutamine/lysine-rich protein 1-like [Drosophila suzukii]|uniref:Splicing regulatory glutamine/lysine-rich protein 1-like n=1 Tax=Drosophila suzukii TaxID=28584 RepID=A0ABM4TYD8_DROSZ